MPKGFLFFFVCGHLSVVSVSHGGGKEGVRGVVAGGGLEVEVCHHGGALETIFMF